MDVLDCSWSPRQVLASGSIDNKVLIWGDFEQAAFTSVVKAPLHTLDAHKSFVKGVAFDPTGKYLASCCADNFVIIWDALDWKMVIRLDDPMKDSPDRAIYRRMCWAPDGNSLCLSSAFKSQKPIGMVIKRGSWESVADLVGHEAQSTSCRFFPNVLTAPNQGRRIPLCTLALGDQAGVVSLWSTDKSAPYLVLRECFKGSVTDLTWAMGEKSRILIVSSLDGTLVFVTFSGDVVEPMSEEQLDEHFVKLYGEKKDELTRSSDVLIDNPLALEYLQSMDKQASAPPPTVQATAVLPRVAVRTAILGTQEVSFKNGKKRIRPVLSHGETDDFQPIQGVVADQPIHAQSAGDHSLNGLPKASNGHAALSADAHQPNGSNNHREIQSAVHPSTVSTLQISFEADQVLHSFSRPPAEEGILSQVRVEQRSISAATESNSRPFIIRARLSPAPSALLCQRSLSSMLTVVTLERGDEVLWTSVVVGEVSAVAACSDSIDSVSEGICGIGTCDGSLHLLCIASGTRLFSPMTLGLPVTHLSAKRSPERTHILAVTADGQCRVWEFADNRIRCALTTSLKPVVLSMKLRKAEDSPKPKPKSSKHGVRVDLDRCYLNSEGLIVAYLRSKGAIGGDTQVFAYCPSTMVWVRLADMRHMLSSSFAPLGSTHSELDELERDAAKESGLSTAEVLTISRARLLAPTRELRRFDSNITLAHIEERICASIIINSSEDARRWLREWTVVCSRSKMLEGKVRWLVKGLLSPSHQQGISFPIVLFFV